jgi:PrtD family type I secretion system ABC transporter
MRPVIPKGNPASVTSGDSGRELRASFQASRGSLLATGAFSFCINLLMLTVPLYMLQVYDRVLSSRSVSTLLALTGIAVGMLLVMGLLDAIRGRVLVRIGANVDARLNLRVFSAVFAAARRDRGASRGQPLRDLDNLRHFLTGPGPFALFDVPWIPVYAFVIYLLHPSLGLIAAAGALALVLVALLNELRTRPPLQDANRETAGAHALAENSLRNAEVLHALGMEEALCRRWRQCHDGGIGYQALASDRGGSLAACSKTLRLMLQVAVLGVGASLAIQQVITPGMMIAASILMGRALAPVELAISQWRSFVAARDAYRRLDELLGAFPAPEDHTELPPPVGRLAVEDLLAAPPGAEKPVLAGVSFTVEPGEALGVIGPTACGKSTLARHLVGVWEPLRGAVRLDGADLRDWHRAGLGPHLGYLPQDVELFAGTVAENIARLASEPDSRRVVRAAKWAGAHEMILRLPMGYDTPIGVDGSVLSGGQRQRIGLARALYGDPALVVLDEPNANLDSDGDRALAQAIQTLKRAKKTVVVLVHRPAALSVVDKVLVLGDGRVQAFGPKQEILGASGRVRTGGAATAPPRRAVRVQPPATSEGAA